MIERQVSDRQRRPPDFLVIGAMKCGTTTIHRWLGEQPGCYLPEWKEVNFFTSPLWERGVDWYRSLFEQAPSAAITGESSPAYTDPRFAALAADRIAETLPDVRLIFLVRHPIERLRSHYGHEVQRGREQRPLREAIRDEESPYVQRSLYNKSIRPYLDRFERDRLLIVRMRDLVVDPNPGWTRVLDHLGLQNRRAPGTAFNVTADTRRRTRGFDLIERSGIYRRRHSVPGPIRDLAKTVVMRRDRSLHRKRSEPLPEAVTQRIWDETRRFEADLGLSKPLWDPTGRP